MNKYTAFYNRIEALAYNADSILEIDAFDAV